MANTGNTKSSGNSGGALGFEATLWATADKLRGNLDAAEYKHVVLGLIFLKYISDAFAEKQAALLNDKGVLPRDYARPSLDKVRLGGLVDITSNIGFNESAAQSKEVPGRV